MVPNWSLEKMRHDAKSGMVIDHSPSDTRGSTNLARLIRKVSKVDPTRAYYIYGNNAIAWANTLKKSTENALCVRSLGAGDTLLEVSDDTERIKHS